MKSQNEKLKKKLWSLCVEYVRLRDNWTCQHCDKLVTKSNAHTSHVIPKSHGNVLRFDEQNLKLLCYHCHLNWFHKNPIEAADWFKKKFPERYEYIMKRKEEYFKIDEIWLIKQIEVYELVIKQLQTQYK
jgi:5-methylcytosine-specific restriction endonuclease McrA